MDTDACAGGAGGQGLTRPSRPAASRLDPRAIPAAAEQLGVECGGLERVHNSKAPITPELALCIGFVRNSRAGLWLDLRTVYDPALARRRTATA